MRSDDATFRILALCASQPGSARVSERLLRLTAVFESWDALLKHAEDHGLEPLLRAHLVESGILCPQAWPITYGFDGCNTRTRTRSGRALPRLF